MLDEPTNNLDPITEDGTHDGLLEGGGEYARLYSTQAQWYDR